MDITPWTAKTDDVSFKYDDIITKFGVSPINEDLIKQFELVTNQKPHKWLRRGIFFAHQDINLLLDNYQKSNPFYLYTGRGPSSSKKVIGTNNEQDNSGLHLGHMLPFYFTKYLQDAFDVPLTVQMSDDEKYYFKDIELDEVYKNTFENAKDIISCGFDKKKTFIFSDLDYMGHMYRNVVKLDKLVTCNQIKGIFGLNLTGENSCNIGQVGWATKQAAPCFPDSFPHLFGKRKDIQCLVPCAIDQSPYFRMVRDYSEKLGYKKPALMYNQFLVSLAGPNEKMSTSSDPKYTIFMTDTPDVIKTKITKYAYSGGATTLAEHRAKGADLEKDVSYQYLRVFLDDDVLLDKITHDYGKGLMLTKDVKDILITVLVDIVSAHQLSRSTVDDVTLGHFIKF